METIHRDYSHKDVQFFYIYKALAHPEHNGYVTPINLEERLLHVNEAERTLGSDIPWICDSMDNTLKHALGNAPNSEFIIGPDGIVQIRRAWSDPDALRKDLVEFVGPIESPTRITDLNLPTQPPPDTVAKGIVPRIQLPTSSMQPVKVLAKSTKKDHPYYVKLRAEATQDLLRSGNGQLYIGFFMDPLHHVHWNNLTEPLRYQVSLPEGIHATPPSGSAPKVEHPADADPREFLIELSVNSDQKHKPFEIVIDYFACDNDNTFCIPVRQVFEVTLEQDRDGGRVRRRPSGPLNARNSRPFRGNIPPWFFKFDKDRNRSIDTDELEQVPELLRSLDHNKDGVISRTEFRALMFNRSN